MHKQYPEGLRQPLAFNAEGQDLLSHLCDGPNYTTESRRGLIFSLLKKLT